ncbi:MAG: acyl-CoA dehydrogenase family protein [Deferrisomatales bacterium]|nr:acyl-CoA dehydrogenase family protein [Deferrisomatales bacterium]
MREHAYSRGASFLLNRTGAAEVFTPGDFTPEQRMFAKAARDFVEREVFPVSDRIEEKEAGLMAALIRKAGALGLLAADIPEAYGGLGLDKTTSALIFENLAGQGSFLVVFGGQVGIGCLPIVYYGSHETRLKYLPSIADGTKIGCFALTEPAAGSDAMACRTKAVLSGDGRHYVLNGTKQFITSAGIADIFIVFAKVDGAGLTGFVLERDTPGLSIGPEEHKMGLHGTSTTTVLLDDAEVPIENVLGELGRGHKIAFNILNIGRFKIGSSAVGACKLALGHALSYCLERKQFGKRLVEFGAIREKLGEMFVRTYAAEAVAYRTVGLIDRLLQQREVSEEASLRSIEEYAVECAMVKVIGSETLDYVADEALQCFGGYGYCADYPLERFYRDSRVNRIFEGTNEINRQLIPTMALRKAGSLEFPLHEALEQAGVAPADRAPVAEDGPLAQEGLAVERLKELCLFSIGLAVRRHGKALSREQALVSRLADLMMAVYRAESTLLRALKDAGRKGQEAALLAISAARLVCEDALEQGGALARQVLAATESGPGLHRGLSVIGRLTEREPADTLALREGIAARLVELERLPAEY